MILGACTMSSVARRMCMMAGEQKGEGGASGVMGEPVAIDLMAWLGRLYRLKVSAGNMADGQN